ncbi:unnamed protein product [Prorocentrum cordatum]|uniref:Calx-beta domain-containing protein n=1 Tax=Prorocentrum cordatum TaxID=2364126 RepID=A0ABN9QHI5_9DINO|nr:unnamed protein product [Polarella glacialis]
MGSSAPEILLAVIETVGNGFEAGSLGPATIVGSAAFNLLVITAVCVSVIPEGETRAIEETQVFCVTALFSILAYVWLVFIVAGGQSYEVVEPWESAVTLALFPALVFLAWLADKGLLGCRGSARVHREGFAEEAGGLAHLEAEVLQRFATCMPDEEIVKLAESEFGAKRSLAMYRDRATIKMISGGLSALEPGGRAGSKESRLRHAAQAKAEQGAPAEPRCAVEFASAHYSVLERAGATADLVVCRRGPWPGYPVRARVATRDGTATAGQDFVMYSGEVLFGKEKDTEARVSVEILQNSASTESRLFHVELLDVSGAPPRGPGVSGGEPAVSGTQSAPASLWLSSSAHDRRPVGANPRAVPVPPAHVVLGPVRKAEVRILDTDSPGILKFASDTLEFVEGPADAACTVVVLRVGGSQGEVSCTYRTEDGTACSGVDYVPSSGTLVFPDREDSRCLQVMVRSRGRFEVSHSFRVVLEDRLGLPFIVEPRADIATFVMSTRPPQVERRRCGFDVRRRSLNVEGRCLGVKLVLDLPGEYSGMLFPQMVLALWFDRRSVCICAWVGISSTAGALAWPSKRPTCSLDARAQKTMPTPKAHPPSECRRNARALLIALGHGLAILWRRAGVLVHVEARRVAKKLNVQDFVVATCSRWHFQTCFEGPSMAIAMTRSTISKFTMMLVIAMLGSGGGGARGRAAARGCLAPSRRRGCKGRASARPRLCRPCRRRRLRRRYARQAALDRAPLALRDREGCAMPGRRERYGGKSSPRASTRGAHWDSLVGGQRQFVWDILATRPCEFPVHAQSAGKVTGCTWLSFVLAAAIAAACAGTVETDVDTSGHSSAATSTTPGQDRAPEQNSATATVADSQATIAQYLDAKSGADNAALFRPVRGAADRVGGAPYFACVAAQCDLKDSTFFARTPSPGRADAAAGCPVERSKSMQFVADFVLLRDLTTKQGLVLVVSLGFDALRHPAWRLKATVPDPPAHRKMGPGGQLALGGRVERACSARMHADGAPGDVVETCDYAGRSARGELSGRRPPRDLGEDPVLRHRGAVEDGSAPRQGRWGTRGAVHPCLWAPIKSARDAGDDLASRRVADLAEDGGGATCKWAEAAETPIDFNVRASRNNQLPDEWRGRCRRPAARQ